LLEVFECIYYLVPLRTKEPLSRAQPLFNDIVYPRLLPERVLSGVDHLLPQDNVFILIDSRRYGLGRLEEKPVQTYIEQLSALFRSSDRLLRADE
jgi:hypothetical protein